MSLFAKCDFSHLLLGGTARDGGQEIIGQGIQSTIEIENRFQKKQLHKKNENYTKKGARLVNHLAEMWSRGCG